MQHVLLQRSFIVCVALGLGAVLFPLHVNVPRGVLLMFAATPVLAGVALIGATTARSAGVALLAAFGVSIWYLVLTAVLTAIQKLIERRLGVGQRKAGKAFSADAPLAGEHG